MKGSTLPVVKMCFFFSHILDLWLPHSVKEGPTVFSNCPRKTGVNCVKAAFLIIEIPPSTNNKLPPRQEGEAVVKARLRQVRDRAGRRVVGAGRQREQVGAPEDGNVVPAADDYVAF